MNALFLDDDESRWRCFREQWTGGHAFWTVTSSGAIRILEAEANDLDVIFLDHDLEPGHYGKENPEKQQARTGASVAAWMAAHSQNFRPGLRVVIHSLNHSGARRMAGMLEGMFHVTIDPFAWATARKYLQALETVCEEDG